MFKDTRGLEMTASSQEAVDAFDATVAEFLAAGREAAVLLKHVNETDPDMIMGQCVRGYFMWLPQQAHLIQGSDDAYAKAVTLLDGANPREKMHVSALEAWCKGDIRRTNAIWEQILVEYPHDILALRIAHTMHFFLGDLDLMRDSMARVMPRWSEDIPGYGFVLGCRAFSLEESHDFKQAEPMGRRAVEINESDIWAGHCVAHVLEGMGRRQDGIEWIDSHEEAWKKRGIFARHMWWHRALHYLELERFDDVLAAYDREYWPEPTEDNIDLTNASSMLMRLAMLGIDVGGRWESVAKICEGRTKHRLRPFNDLHFIMALAMTGRMEAAREIVASMRAYVAENDRNGITLIDVYQNAGIPVGDSIVAYAEKDYSKGVEIMSGVRYRMVPLGGSWAQRDVWLRMLIDAAIQDGQHAYARALLAERTTDCPTSGPSWNMYASVLDSCGESVEAKAARARATELLAA
ncbi:MAG: tetratricopeptide repeat protein [Pseudomonadota bacterium]|nr:tetratricopeptide repeat protein [Pseudomonadota bacterium]